MICRSPSHASEANAQSCALPSAALFAESKLQGWSEKSAAPLLRPRTAAQSEQHTPGAL